MQVEKYMPEHDTSGLDIEIMAPEQAIVESMERAKAGKVRMLLLLVVLVVLVILVLLLPLLLLLFCCSC